MGVGYCFGLGCLAVDAMIVAIRTNIVSVSVCLSLFVLIGTHVHTHTQSVRVADMSGFSSAARLLNH